MMMMKKKFLLDICKLMTELKPVLVMVMVQVAYGGVNVLYKLASSDGMSLRIIIAYRFIFASAFMIPLALFFERKNRPKLTWMILFQAFLCGLFGLEKLGIRTLAGKAKVVGTLMGIGGAMLLTLYKGAEIKIWKSNIDLLKNYQSHGLHSLSSHSNHALGCLLAMATCFSYALWLIIQAKMSERYPCPYSSTALMSLMASIQTSVYALCMEKDWSQWRLGWNIRLLTAAYAGIVVAGIMVTLVIWCVRLKGPLFVSVFNPLMLLCTAFAGSILLNENLHLGSILGATLIVCGLYAVLWGKNVEMKKMSRLVPLKSTSKEAETIEVVLSSPKNDNCNNHSNVEDCN